MFHGLDPTDPVHVFAHLPVLAFTEAFIYQLDDANEVAASSELAVVNAPPPPTLIGCDAPACRPPSNDTPNTEQPFSGEPSRIQVSNDREGDADEDAVSAKAEAPGGGDGGATFSPGVVGDREARAGDAIDATCRNGGGDARDALGNEDEMDAALGGVCEGRNRDGDDGRVDATFAPLLAALEAQLGPDAVTPRLRRELADGVLYWALERRLCAG
jgi:hypothetical protein